MRADSFISGANKKVPQPAFAYSSHWCKSGFLGTHNVRREVCKLQSRRLYLPSSTRNARVQNHSCKSDTYRRWRLGIQSLFVVLARGSDVNEGKLPEEEKSIRSTINRVLTSRTVAMSFIVISSLSYIVAICLIARTISSVYIQPYQRIILLGLGLLLPDFRHVLKSYSEAVHHLQQYKPAFQGFRFGKVGKDEDSKSDDADALTSTSELPSWKSHPHYKNLLKTVRQWQEKFDENAEKFDQFLANLSKDVTRPIVETSTQIQQLTVGTDLTLQKNVVVAAASVSLSLAGYAAGIVGEPSVGGVAIMLASLLPNALLTPKRHEMLALIQDGRVALSLIGTMSCVMSVFFPMCASYCFLLCCLALVVSRFPMDRGFT